jgi:RNA ligase
VLSEGVTTILDAVSRWGPDLRAYKALGNIAVAVEPQAELLLFNYTARATYENTWNAVEVVSRGLIVHWPSAQLAALPFPKFFNVGQRSETALDALGAHSGPVEVTSKLDGSLGILFRRPDGFAIATRGAFASPQALWAIQHIRAHYDLSALPRI